MPNKYNIQARRLALDNLVRARAWNSFRDSFAAAEDASLLHAIVQCRHHQTTHRTLLHSLCDIPPDANPPPAEVVQLVARACPRALILHEPGNERTPLHLAIYQGASLATIQALAEAADAGESFKRQDMLVSLDFKCQTPLLAAVRGGAPDDTVKYLVNEDADGSSLLLTGLRKKNREYSGVPLKYVASNECAFVDFGLSQSQDLLRFMLVRTYRAKLKRRFPLLYAKSEGNNDEDVCLLQATIFCYELLGSKQAASILSFIIRNGLFHRERLDTRRDVAGNLTLHIACLSDTQTFDQILRLGDRATDYGLNSEDCTLVEYLVNANPPPSTAPYLSRNYEGDIPLHCAVKSGKEWSQMQLLVDACPSSVECCSAKGELPLHLAIKCGAPSDVAKKLWNTYPDATSITDKSTGLYAFQLAAVFGRKRKRPRGKQKKKSMKIEGGDVWDATSLSFFLLRECPSVITALLRAAE